MSIKKHLSDNVLKVISAGDKGRLYIGSTQGDEVVTYVIYGPLPDQSPHWISKNDITFKIDTSKLSEGIPVTYDPGPNDDATNVQLDVEKW